MRTTGAVDRGRRARSHCSAAHDVPPVISRVNNRSKNPVTATTRWTPSRISAPAVVAALAIPLRQYLEAFSDPDALGDLLRPDTLSVGVRRDMIFRSTLVTATTRTGKPCISFSLNTTAESDKWWFVVRRGCSRCRVVG